MKNNAHWRSFETVFEVYFSLRGPQYQLKDDADADEMWREMQDQLRQGEGRGAAGGMESLTPEELAQLLYQALMNGDEAHAAGAGPPGGEPVRRHGAGPPGRRHLLPLPDAAEPRPRGAARASSWRRHASRSAAS